LGQGNLTQEVLSLASLWLISKNLFETSIRLIEAEEAYNEGPVLVFPSGLFSFMAGSPIVQNPSAFLLSIIMLCV
jgi:hypothetical protein